MNGVFLCDSAPKYSNYEVIYLVSRDLTVTEQKEIYKLSTELGNNIYCPYFIQIPVYYMCVPSTLYPYKKQMQGNIYKTFTKKNGTRLETILSIYSMNYDICKIKIEKDDELIEQFIKMYDPPQLIEKLQKKLKKYDEINYT